MPHPGYIFQSLGWNPETPAVVESLQSLESRFVQWESKTLQDMEDQRQEVVMVLPLLPQKLDPKASCYSLNWEFQRSLSLTIIFRQLFSGWRFRAVDNFIFGMSVAINKQPFFAGLGTWGIPFCFQRFLINF
jgi:hypothetical protein